MMRTGYWLNFETGHYADIGVTGDHSQWIHNLDNSSLVGLPAGTLDGFVRFDPVDDRNTFLGVVLVVAPLVRIRGRRESVSCEFVEEDTVKVMQAIGKWAEEIGGLGPQTHMHLVNMSETAIVDVTYHQMAVLSQAG